MSEEELILGGSISYETVRLHHPQHQGVYTLEHIARSIICNLSPGARYPDRWIQEGRILEYTGQGDPDRGDQLWNSYNLGLRIAMEEMSPIKVFERLGGHPVRYRYHGEWYIHQLQRMFVPSRGQRVFRFIISSEEPPGRPISPLPILGPDICPDVSEPPARIRANTYRILRDTVLARRIKERYGYRCQICGGIQKIGDERQYAEAHHIRPLGHPHDGPDAEGNIIVLCPAHHVDFDYGAIAIDPNDGRTIRHLFDSGLDGQQLYMQRRYRLDQDCLEYHWQEIFQR